MLSTDQRIILRGLAMERALRQEGPLEVDEESLGRVLAQGPADVADRADRLLINLSMKSSEPGAWTALTSRYHGGYGFIAGVDAFLAWLDFLHRDGDIEYTRKQYLTLNDISFRLTLGGWRRVRELKALGALSNTGFVAMPFDAQFERLWAEGIVPAFAMAGWKPIRADRVHHNDRIDDWILNRIRTSRFIVVDVTGNNPGACFEAGYALGASRPVIWTVQRDARAGIHFDFRQFNNVSWVAGQEPAFANSLAERILNTVGTGRA